MAQLTLWLQVQILEARDLVLLGRCDDAVTAAVKIAKDAIDSSGVHTAAVLKLNW